jgi:hypothetical protein
MRGDGNGDLHRIQATRAKVPSVRDDRVTEVHDETRAGIYGRRGVVGDGRVVEPAHPHFAAVVEVEEQPMVAAAQIDRLENEDIHGVLDHATGVDRCPFDIGDYRVAPIRGIELAICGATKLLVLADGAERQSPECGKLGSVAVDNDTPDARLDDR